jgi:hypothetical protein
VDGQLSALLPTVLQEGASCHFTVYYLQDGLGDLHGTFTVISDAASSPDVIPITAVRETTVFWSVPVTDHARATVAIDGPPGCGFTEVAWLAPPGQQNVPPKGFVFPHGLLHFELRPCVPGETKLLHLDFANPLPPGTKYLKFGPTPDDHAPHWYEVPSTVQGTTIAFSITDGGLGDDDLIANGVIADQGGPAVPMRVSATPTAVPTLSFYALLAMLTCLIGVGMNAIVRRGIKR